jgi:quercetin dioxygenase-like cupin family protein
MKVEQLNKKREEYMKHMRDSSAKLQAMVKPINGKYMVAECFECENLIDDDVAQVITCVAKSEGSMGRHCHPKSREFIVVLSGGIEVKTDTETFLLRKGETIMLKCGEQHETKVTVIGTRIIAVLLPPEGAFKNPSK